MKKELSALVTAGLTLLLGGTARAHIGIAENGTANTTQVTTFSVGHGCSGADTYSVEIKIPASVTSVRPMFGGALGVPKVNKDSTGAITSVVWEKSGVLDADFAVYELSIRMKLPDVPFTTLYFPATQKCRTAAGEELPPVEWFATTRSTDENGPEPAPALVILPAHRPGWNKFTVPVAIMDLSIFDNAQIVWAGNAAYSSNPTTTDLIKNEPDTTVLSNIAAGTEIWVKY